MVCVEAWAVVRGRGLVWEMESVSVTPDTLVICARTVLMDTSERKVLMTASEPVQVPQILTLVSDSVHKDSPV